MKNRNEIYEELKGISPFLSSLKTPQKFDVPEGYFDSLADKVMMANQTENPQTGGRISWLGSRVYRVSVAASFLILCSFFTWRYLIFTPAVQPGLAYDEVMEFVIDDVSYSDLEDLYNSSDGIELFSISDLEFEGDDFDEFLDQNIEHIDPSIFEGIR